LNHPEISRWIERSNFVGKPKLWRNLSNVRRHFGYMDRWPRGLLVLGDALCAFNPVYGQGMTVGAIEAEALAETLAKVPSIRDTAWEQPFQRKVEKLLFIPWFMSTTEDLRNPKFANPSLFTKILHGYFDLVLRAAVHDRYLHVSFLRIMHMMRSPFSLMGPGALVRVVARTFARAFLPPPAAPPLKRLATR
jgi:2-polyprenyl-6-methoxyphenol hydroxylase-like FAD-dependent oxidoreductase